MTINPQITIILHNLTGINRISQPEGLARLNDRHLPYVARMDGQPVGYGWVATRKASIGELNLIFELSSDDRYLWDFTTLPDWQGRGLYPRLLQTISVCTCAVEVKSSRTDAVSKEATA